MAPTELEAEAESDCSAASESSSMVTGSSSSSCHPNKDTSNMEGAEEPNRKVKKLRSIKLTRLPSLKLSTRQAKGRSNYHPVLSSDAPTSQQSTPMGVPDASPSYMKTTTSSDAKKGTLQKSARTLSRRSSFKPAKRLARLSSKRARRTSIRKSSGGDGLLKKSRSARRANWSAIILSSEADASPDYWGETSYSGAKNARFQASLLDCESGITSTDENTKDSIDIKPMLASSDNKSIEAKKVTSTLRPSKVLTKMTSLKTKRSSMKNPSQVLDSSINKATCSSALKDSKLANRLELEPGGSKSEPISFMKVCPYSYCSLHGHHHSDPTSAKYFVSIRRRLLQTQMSMKLKSQEKYTGNKKKGIQTSQMASYVDSAILEAAQESREISQRGKIVSSKSGLNGGTHGDHEDTRHSASVYGMMLDGQSPGELVKETIEFPAGEKGLIVASSTQSEANAGRHSIATRGDELISEDTMTDKKEEMLIEQNSHCGNQKLVLTVDQSDLTAVSIPQQYDELPSTFAESTCHEEVPVGRKVQQEVNGNTMPLDLCKDDPELSILEASPTSVPVEEKITIHGRENHFSSDSDPDSSAGLANKTQMEKQKHMGLWNLVYRHMVSGIATEDDTHPHLDKVEQNEEGKDAITYPVMENPGFSWDYSSADESKVVTDPNEGSQNVQLYKHNAIKLVQEALDKILSEIPDQSSDDQSVTSATNSDKQLSENDDGKDGELTIPASFDSSRDNVLCEAQESNFKNDITGVSGGEKSETDVRKKPNQGTPKSWSNLKKIITLNRFLKTLEKVKDLNPRKPRYLPSEPDPEAEKVQLRHQTMLERKNSEEWMLDYALQKVISTLAPAQKRKVSLLVQAFETVIPLPEIGTHSIFNAANSSQTTPVQNGSGSSDRQDSGRGKAPNFGILLPKTSRLDMNFKENQNQISDFSTTKGHIAPDLKETSLASTSAQTELGTLASETPTSESKEEVAAFKFDYGSDNSILKDDRSKLIDNSSVELLEPGLLDKPPPRQVENLRTSREESLSNEKNLQEAPDQAGLFSASEVHDPDFKFHKDKLKSENQIQATHGQSGDPKIQIQDYSEESISNNGVASSPFISEQLEESSAISEAEMKIKNKLIQVLNPPEESESNCSTGTVPEKQMETQKHMQFWYLIYKHMLSGTTTVLEGADKEEQSDDANLKVGMNYPHSDLGPTAINQDINVENDAVSSQKIELQQIEAIRLLEEAIDEIPLPEIQDDSSDDRSITSDVVPDQDEEELFPSASIRCSTESFGESNIMKVKAGATLDTKDSRVNSDKNADQQVPETVLKAGNSHKLPKQKSWGHLKKMILLKRFIKALEKVEKFNPGKPRFLPLDPVRDAEKVNLRHQDMEDRKHADEWMLDSALQQVVSKLTPVRQRKVKLLVEAFETVIPTVRS